MLRSWIGQLEPEKKVDEMEATIRLYEEEGIAKKKKKKRLSSVYPIKIQGGVTVPVESVNRKEP